METSTRIIEIIVVDYHERLYGREILENHSFRKLSSEKGM